ncbi:MAG: potassium channel family protein [Actinomycetota bacterium]|jgi:uncharacterized membrane protein|nr:potassium channel family protein [Actinomycetota bacterium]
MTNPRPGTTPGVGSPRRLEMLTDGVFAIVMTLIVLQIAIPRGPAAQLPQDLANLVPTLLVYALTFVTLGTLWFGNRTQSEFVSKADHPLVWLTLLMLLFVALVPFSAGLIGRYPDSRVAVVLYGVHLTVVFTLHACLWLYVSLRPRLLREGLTARYLKWSRLAAFAAAIGYAIATGLGAIAPLAGLIGFLVVPIPFVTGLYYRGLASIDRKS